jgi:hypothetical protein
MELFKIHQKVILEYIALDDETPIYKIYRMIEKLESEFKSTIRDDLADVKEYTSHLNTLHEKTTQHIKLILAYKYFDRVRTNLLLLNLYLKISKVVPKDDMGLIREQLLGTFDKLEITYSIVNNQIVIDRAPEFAGLFATYIQN